jgi:hypothetical protein
MGRPVHFTTGGYATLATDRAPTILAGVTILSYVARLAAANRARLMVTVSDASSIALLEQVVREAYLAEGHPEQYDPTIVRHLSGEQFAFMASVQAIIQREQVAANILVGPFAAEVLPMLEAGYRMGAINISGAEGSQIAYIFAASDHVLIGDEIFAAGAYISKDPVQVATIFTEDVVKVAALALLTVGAIVTLYSGLFINLLRM